MRGVETIRTGAVCVGVCLGLMACPADTDQATEDAGSGDDDTDAGGHPDGDAGPSGVDTIVIGEHCPYPEVPGPVPPRISVRGGIEYWSLEPGCIAITYQPDLDAAQVAHLEAAVSAFDDVACSQLCLESPVAQAFDPAQLDLDLLNALASLGRRIHFMVDRRALANGGLTEVNTDAQSSVMLGAFVFLPETPADPLQRGDFVQLLGATLGLGGAASGVDSVMSPERPQPRSLPTALDAALLCELYGDDPLCE